jgi:hypothetical protein
MVKEIRRNDEQKRKSQEENSRTQRHQKDVCSNEENGHDLTVDDVINLEKNNIIWPRESQKYEIWSEANDNENEIAEKFIKYQALI